MRVFARRLTLGSAHLPQPWQRLSRKQATLSHIITLVGRRVGKCRKRSAAFLGSGIKSSALDLHFFETAYKTQANICALGSPQMKTFKFCLEHCLLTRSTVRQSRSGDQIQPCRGPYNCGMHCCTVSDKT